MVLLVLVQYKRKKKCSSTIFSYMHIFFFKKKIGLKTVILEVDPSKGNQVCTRIIPRLLTTIQSVSSRPKKKKNTREN